MDKSSRWETSGKILFFPEVSGHRKRGSDLLFFAFSGLFSSGPRGPEKRKRLRSRDSVSYVAISEGKTPKLTHYPTTWMVGLTHCPGPGHRRTRAGFGAS